MEEPSFSIVSQKKINWDYKRDYEKKKVALLGGSFDPIHWGHLNMAKAALEHLKVDEVWFIPSNQTPLKDRVLSPAADRLAMVRLALKEDPRFKISTVDLSRNGKSYTFDTLKILKNSSRKLSLPG